MIYFGIFRNWNFFEKKKKKIEKKKFLKKKKKKFEKKTKNLYFTCDKKLLFSNSARWIPKQ